MPYKSRAINTKQDAYDYIAAQFFQLGASIKAIRKICPDGVLHARHAMLPDHDGRERQVVILYARPRPDNDVAGFFDRLLHGQAQDLAQQVLSSLVACGKAAAGSESLMHCLADEPEDELPSTTQLSLESLQSMAETPGQLNLLRDSANGFEAIADAIRLQKLNAADVVYENAGNLRHCIRNEEEFKQWRPDADDDAVAEIQRASLVSALESHGFPTEQVEGFDALVHDIRNLRDTPKAPLDAYLSFSAQWVRRYGSESQRGRNFRKFVQGCPRLRAWNVVAHYLAWRDHVYVKEAVKTCFTRCGAPLQTPSPFPFHKGAAAPKNARRHIERLRVQRGITPNDWNDAAMIMLTRPACLLAENNPPGLALKKIPETREFPGPEQDVDFVPRRKKGRGIDHSRCLALAPEVAMDGPAENGGLNERQAAEISGTYFRVIKRAVEIKAKHLILVPCFDLGRDHEAQALAIHQIFDTLDLMANLPPDLALTIAAGSARAEALTKEELKKWKRARNASDIDDLAF